MSTNEEYVRECCINKLAESTEIYPGYPRIRYRNAQNKNIPPGPWDTEQTTAETFQLSTVNRDYEHDSYGRPIHPWFGSIVSKIGMFAGRGAYWNWGPNATADPIVIAAETSPKVLLIQRSDTGDWAFPGGFVDGHEDPIEAAIRECQQETHAQITSEPTSLVYRGVVADRRTTAHAWAETNAYMWFLDHTTAVKAGDDAVNAEWFDLRQLPPNIHGSHSALLTLALKELVL